MPEMHSINSCHTFQLSKEHILLNIDCGGKSPLSSLLRFLGADSGRVLLTLSWLRLAIWGLSVWLLVLPD